MNLMFWKKKAGDEETRADDAVTADESSAPEMPVKPRLLMRIKAGFAVFAGKFKPGAASAADKEQDVDISDNTKVVPENEHMKKELKESPEEESDIKPPRSKKLLFAGAAFGLTVILLIGIWITIWPIFTSAGKPLDARHDIAPVTSRPIKTKHAPEKPQAEIEELKKKNAELQARVEELSKKSPQQPAGTPSGTQSGSNKPSISASGDLSIGNNDPKSAALTLKEAIETMNDASGGYNKKTAGK